MLRRAGTILVLLALITTGGLAQAATKRFHLYATDGWAQMADGTRVYIWGFSDVAKKGSATLPGPTLVVGEGDSVEVTLTNLGFAEQVPDPPHTIHLHGLDVDQANDGVPHTSPDVPAGSSFTYRLVATHAGTYWYHCHVDTIQHLQMGMYGALIVHARGGAQQAWTGGPAYDREYAFVLSEIDPSWHDAVYAGRSYDRTDYHPRYFLINGASFPDVMRIPADHLQASLGQTLLVRLINAGYQSHAMHLHGFHFTEVASDGRPLPAPIVKDTILIGPGERYDLLITPDKPGEYPFHSHMIVDNTNNGVYPGGIHTMIDVATEAGEDGSVLYHPLSGKPGAAAAPDTPAVAHAAMPRMDMGGMDGGGTDVGALPAEAGGGGGAAAAVGEGVVVHAKYNTFDPPSLTVKPGTTVTWFNDDFAQHDIRIALGNGKTVKGPAISYHGHWSYTFTEPGTYRYICTIHAGMRGMVTVRA